MVSNVLLPVRNSPGKLWLCRGLSRGVHEGDTLVSVLAYMLAVWLSGSALASITVVALRQTQLVPGWVTVCGPVNHLSM